MLGHDSPQKTFIEHKISQRWMKNQKHKVLCHIQNFSPEKKFKFYISRQLFWSHEISRKQPQNCLTLTNDASYNELFTKYTPWKQNEVICSLSPYQKGLLWLFFLPGTCHHLTYTFTCLYYMWIVNPTTTVPLYCKLCEIRDFISSTAASLVLTYLIYAR